MLIWYYKNKKDLPLKLKPRVWSKPLTLVDGEKMMGWVAANYLFCVPTIAAATPEVPTLSREVQDGRTLSQVL